MPNLVRIVAMARAGALEQAWRLFRQGGFDDADPAVLAVKGRLLKDEALLASGVARQSKLRASAAAYAAADAIRPEPYLLINVATLAFLGGSRARAEVLAGEVLERLGHAARVAETPYWLAATRAEALLLRGQLADAEQALGEAIARDPDSWADHAATLRQLALITRALDLDPSWLEPHRPPRSLHFAGHLGVRLDAGDALRAAVDPILKAERIGFGYGALAAGADILVAEALIDRGAALHVVLPTDPATFVARSVGPYGASWLTRFEGCLAAARSFSVATSLADDYEPLATALAADLAAGAAVLNARLLQSEAIQLLVVDDGPAPYGDGVSTARDGRLWSEAQRRQHLVRWPRDDKVPASGSRAEREGRTDRQLIAMLHVALEGMDDLDDAQLARLIDSGVLPVGAAGDDDDAPPTVVITAGNALTLIFDTVGAAWAHSQNLLRASSPSWPICVTAHYAVAYWLGAPSGPVGAAVVRLGRIAVAALPGTVTASDTFATALLAHCDEPIHAELVGEIDGGQILTLRPNAAN